MNLSRASGSGSSTTEGDELGMEHREGGGCRGDISLALWTLGKGQESSRGKKLIYVSIRSKSPNLSALPPPKKAAQEGTHSHCGIQEHPKDMVQLSSPLLCCLPLAQNLSGISLEFMSAKKKDQQILSPLVCSSLRSALHLENKKTTSDIKTTTCGPGLSPSSRCSIQPGHELFTQSQWFGNPWELTAGLRNPLQGQTPSQQWVCAVFVRSVWENSTAPGSCSVAASPPASAVLLCLTALPKSLLEQLLPPWLQRRGLLVLS